MNDRRFAAVVTKEENWYVGRCLELEVVSQGKTIEETQANLKEAVKLYLESFGSDDQPQSLGTTRPRSSVPSQRTE
ncbi:MAG TPA: type II toxin-antitoxin system HicB family antitoxin [bacterium]|nr:type II toxin-antitoxin system HicB family antitoxin [bacterium]